MSPRAAGPPASRCGSIPLWEAVAALIITALPFIGASVAVDENWARREFAKRFNWLSLVDELVVASLAVLAIYYFEMQRDRLLNIEISWPTLAITCGVSILLAILLELLRPWHPVEDLRTVEILAQEEDIHRYITSGQQWIYAERQNSKWINVGIIAFSILMFACAYDSWNLENPPAFFTCLLLAVLVFAFWGGFLITVSETQVTVGFGLLAIRLLRICIRDIAEAVIHEFSPLQDFGGVGVRFNREMKGFFLKWELRREAARLERKTIPDRVRSPGTPVHGDSRGDGSSGHKRSTQSSADALIAGGFLI